MVLLLHLCDLEIPVHRANTRKVKYFICSYGNAAKTDNVDGNGPVYFATSNDHYSVREIAEKISQIIGGSVDYIDPPTKIEAITIGDFIVSNKKIMSKLGWNPKIDLVDGLKRTKDFFSSRLSDYLPE